MKPLNELVCPNILRMNPEWSVRGSVGMHENCVFLDADENPYNSPYNRYPDQAMTDLKIALSKVKGVAFDNIYIIDGHGASVDLLYRCFCCSGVDNVVAIEPTRKSYGRLAELNGIEYRRVLLDENFQISGERLLDACDSNTKIVWLCSPNVPSGNVISASEVGLVLDMFDGIVVVDESYSDFTRQPSWRLRLRQYPNLVVLGSMDNSWGCAAIGLSMAFASAAIVEVLEKIRIPYIVNSLTQKVALQQLRDPFEAEKWTRTIVVERQRMVAAFRDLQICVRAYPSDANFVLVEFVDSQAIYNYLLEKGIVVDNCCGEALCGNCLRITVGSKIENNELLSALRQY